jgi:hypothetical protein
MTTVAEAVDTIKSRMMARREEILGDLPPLGFKPVNETTTFEYDVRYLLLVQSVKRPTDEHTNDIVHSEIALFCAKEGSGLDIAYFKANALKVGLQDVHYVLEIGSRSAITGFMKEQDLLNLFAPEPKNRAISPRLTMLVKVSNDLDAIPGWGYVASDWVNMLAKGGYMNQGHYNTKLEVVGAEVT